MKLTPGIDDTSGGSGGPSTTGAGNPWTDDELNAATAYFQNLVGPHPDWGNASDAIPFYQQKRQQGLSHDQALSDVANYLGWNKPAVPAPAPQPATPAPAPAQSSGGGGGSISPSVGSILQPFTETFTAPTPLEMPKGYDPGPAPIPNLPAYRQAPAFSYDVAAPTFTAPDAFKSPSIADVMASDGYQFRVNQGNRGIEKWAAARGTLNSSQAGKALSDYNQNAASQEYENAWQRDYNAWQGNLNASIGKFNSDLATYGANRQNAVDTYNENYKTQYADPYAAAYQSAMDMFTPQLQAYNAKNNAGMLDYSTRAASIQHQNDVNYQNAYNKWLDDWKMWQDQRDSSYNKLIGYASL